MNISGVKNSNSDTIKENNVISFVTLLNKTADGGLKKSITIKQRHVGSVKWYDCHFCHKAFKKPSDLIRHLRVHTQEKPFKCSECHRSFALKSTMKYHERIHAGEKIYNCGICGKKFSCSGSLQKHAKTHLKNWLCHICDKVLSSPSHLRKHITKHGIKKRAISPDAEALIPQIVLEEPLVIMNAGNEISVEHIKSKQKHVENNKNDGPRPHKCWVCPAAFRKISHLKQHYRRHTGERPFTCSKCDRTFSSNSVLKSHLQTHEGDRPYHCNMCPAKFSTHSSMKRHLVTHSNKRPFMCPYCHKTFKTTVSCRKHMKIHKTELAQMQLDKQRAAEQETTLPIIINNKNNRPASLSENLNLTEDIADSFQQNITTDFVQAFSEQFSTISEDNNTTVTIEHLAEVDTVNMEQSQTLHADESGTITLSNYSEDQTLTPESIREIEETLNQQLFHIGMNLNLSNNLSRQINDSGTENLIESREQPVVNIIYENSKELNSTETNSINTNIFPANFDTFDMSQITLQSDNEMDLGINPANSTSMASILPRSAQEEQHLVIPISHCNNQQDNQSKDKHLLVVSSLQNYPEMLKTIPSSLKYGKIIAKADTTNDTDLLNLHGESSESIQSIPAIIVPQWSCNYCSKPFPGEDELKEHVFMVHLSKNFYSLNDVDNNEEKKPPLMQCHMCYKKEYDAAALQAHLKTHRGLKEFQCTECPQKFRTNGGLSRHLKVHARKQFNTWTCAQCLKTFVNEKQFKFHCKSHDPVNWSTLPNEPDSSQTEPQIIIEPKLLNISSKEIRRAKKASAACATVSHKLLLDTVAEQDLFDRKKAQKIEKKEYENRCKYCPKSFRKPSDLIRHVRTHTGEKPYQCKHCDKSFAVKCTLDCHLKVHEGNEKFCCHICNRLFATKGSLKVHMRLHTGSKPFKCHICQLRFRTSGHRKVHMVTHTREKKEKRKGTNTKSQIVAEADVESAQINASITETPSVTQTNINEPTEYPNLDTITIDTTGIADQLTFNPDGTIINNNAVLSVNESNQLVANLHFLIANGLVTLQADDSLLPQLNPNVSANDTSSHNLLTTNPLNVPCNPPDLSNNLVIAEITEPLACDDERPLQMDVGMELDGMSAAATLNNMPPQIKPEKSKATKNSHPPQKECDICGKTFSKPCQVQRHRRIHTGERPYKCSSCPKSFTQNSTLQMHMKHHTGDRPHSCPHCDYSFTQKCNLQTHLKRVHQLDTIEGKKLKKRQPIVRTLTMPDDNRGIGQNRMPNLEEMTFVELLK